MIRTRPQLSAPLTDKKTFSRLPKTCLRLQLMQNKTKNKVRTCLRNMYKVSMKHLQCIGGAILSLFPHSTGHHAHVWSPTSTNKYTTCTCVPIHVATCSYPSPWGWVSPPSKTTKLAFSNVILKLRHQTSVKKFPITFWPPKVTKIRPLVPYVMRHLRRHMQWDTDIPA